MTKDEQLGVFLKHKIVAVVRAPENRKLVEVAEALVEGGVPIIEMTMTVPHALDVLRAVRERLGNRVVLGAGTVLDGQTARLALLAGAEFVVSPVFRPDCLRLCRRYGKMMIPGALTPTEILTAWEQGADIVKVFPAELGGPAYFRALAGPLPQVRLMPTGGVNLETAGEFLRAGACCLAVGSALVDSQAVAEPDLERIRALAQKYVQIMRQCS